MKKTILTIAFLILTLTAAEANTPVHRAGFGIFYSSLTPYGSWMEIDYGVVVWRPTIMRRDWAPYRMGQWIWTSDGWYWDSYEDFGYITYHYGRWYYDDYYGWLWVPDYDWAPAWVEWRYDDNYVGWAPLSPYATFRIGIGIYFTYEYYTPYNHWHFVKYRYMCDPYVYNHFVGHKYKYRIHANTKYRHDYRYYDGRVQNRGIDINDVRRRSGRDIKEREIYRVSDPREVKNRKDKNEIRTFVASRDELSRGDFDTRDIKRSDRKSTLRTNDVELGDRRKDVRNDEIKNREKQRVVTDDRNDNRKDVKVEEKRPEIIERNKTNDREIIKRDDTKKVETRDRTNVQIEKKETDKKRELPVTERKTEIKRETNQNRNDNVRTQTDRNVEIKRETNTNRSNNTVTEQKRNEVKEQQKRTETQVRRENTQTGRENNSNKNGTTEERKRR